MIITVFGSNDFLRAHCVHRTIPFFPKWRSVGPEPGRTLFFRIVRTGPPGGGPARSFLPDPLSTSLTHPGSIRDRRLVLTVAGLYKTGSCVHVQPLRDHLGSSFDPRDTPARAGHEPDASPRNTLTRATSNASGRGQQEAPPPFPAAPAPGRAARSSCPPRLHLISHSKLRNKTDYGDYGAGAP